MNTQSLFKGKKLWVASKHHKELVMAPIQEKLGCELIAYRDFDTDSLGTFTGEVERVYAPIEAAKAKCTQVHQMTQAELVIASEGSFGPHPEMPFVPGDEEFLVLIDYSTKRSFVTRSISFETNFNAKELLNKQDLKSFLEEAQFPSHAVILKPSKDVFEDMVKGMTEQLSVEEHFDFLMRKYGKAYIETDMRAMHNPSRMKVIAEAVENMIDLLTRACPKCLAPGYRQVGVNPGLPCSWCGQPTDTTVSIDWACEVCGFTETKKRSDRREEDPMYCQYCNP